jgi:hypothetical protein
MVHVSVYHCVERIGSDVDVVVLVVVVVEVVTWSVVGSAVELVVLVLVVDVVTASVVVVVDGSKHRRSSVALQRAMTP